MKEFYENRETAVSCLEELFSDEQKYKQAWGQEAKRCVAFANGDQNPAPLAAPVMVNNNPVYYGQNDPQYNMYVTNEIASIIRTLVSYMTRSQPTAEASSDSRDPQEKNAARITEQVLEAKYYIDNEFNNSRDAAFWAMTTGTVFAKDYWDPSLGDYVSKIDGEGNPILDAEGKPVLMKTGMNSVAILTPFTVHMDHSVIDFERRPFIGDSYVMDVDWAREAFNQNLPGYTGAAVKIAEDNVLCDTMQLLEEMKFSIPYISQGGGFSNHSKGKCLGREWAIRPNKTYPKGRLIIKVGGQVVYDSPPDVGSPYFMPFDPTMWDPFSCFIFEPYIGRFLGRILVAQLIPLQMRLNEINGAILQNANTLAKPNIMAAERALKRGILNGRGANVYTYKVVPGAPPPREMPGVPLPEQFFKEKQMLIDQMVRIAGTNFVMQGQPPTGVTAGSAIQMLLENASNQQSDAMTAWQKFHEQRFQKKIRLLHKFNKYPNNKLNKWLKRICADSPQTEIDDFIGARDLSNGVNVWIQSGSMIPKNASIKNQNYIDLSKSGGLGPAMMEDSPRGEKLRESLLKKIGLEPLDSDESVEIRKAEWENDRLLKGLPVEVSPYDVALVHLPCHIKQIQDPIFLEKATDQQKIAMDNHIKAHQMIEQQKAMAQAQQVAAMAPPMQGPPGQVPGNSMKKILPGSVPPKALMGPDAVNPRLVS